MCGNDTALPTLELGSEASIKFRTYCHLSEEAQLGWDSAKECGWISEEEAYRILDLKK